MSDRGYFEALDVDPNGPWRDGCLVTGMPEDFEAGPGDVVVGYQPTDQHGGIASFYRVRRMSVEHRLVYLDVAPVEVVVA